MNSVLSLALLLSPITTLAAVHGNWKHREDFVQVAEVASSSHIHHDVTFAVKQKNLEQLSRLVLRVSDPDSPSYGQHLTHDQVHAMTANPKAAAAVRLWAASHDDIEFKEGSSHSEYLTFSAPLFRWESTLESKFLTMEHVETGESVLRSQTFTMPTELEEHVAHIFNIIELPSRTGPGAQIHYPTEEEKKEQEKQEKQEKQEQQEQQVGLPYPYPCKSTMKLGCWNYRYNQTTNDATGQHQMVFGQKGAYMAPDDITEWAGSNDINPLKNQMTWSCPNGGCSNTACQGYDPNMKSKGHYCVEGNLDVQFISGIGQNANNTFYWNTNLATPFIEFITHISSLADPPGTVSISYGSYEYEMDHAVMDHFSIEAMKLGAQGVSILSATGDDGVAGYKARNDTKMVRSLIDYFFVSTIKYMYLLDLSKFVPTVDTWYSQSYQSHVLLFFSMNSFFFF